MLFSDYSLLYPAIWPGTPGGYVTVLADEVCAKRRSDSEVSEAALRGRQTALARGNTGTIKNLTKRTAGIAGNSARGQVTLPVRRKKVSRISAIDQGLLRYYTGKPCVKKHLAERYVSNWTCCKCAQEKIEKEWRALLLARSSA